MDRKKDKAFICDEEQDRLNHYLNDWITRISVVEQEEQMEEELKGKNEEG